MFDKRASARPFGFSRADLSSPTQVLHTHCRRTTTAGEMRANFHQKPQQSTNHSPLFSSARSGPHAAPQLVFRPGQRRLVWTAGHFSDWPLPRVGGGSSGGRFQIDWRVLVPPLPIPPGRTHHSRAVRVPGPNRFGEGGCQSQQPSQSGGRGGMQFGE